MNSAKPLVAFLCLVFWIECSSIFEQSQNKEVRILDERYIPMTRSRLRILTQVSNCTQYDQSGTCIECASTYALNGGSCISCGSYCKTCTILSGNTTICTECESGSLYPNILFNGVCYFQEYFVANRSLFLIGGSNKLLEINCPSSCYDCVIIYGTMTCIRAQFGFVSGSSVAKPCDGVCGSCSSVNVCVGCVSGFFLSNNSCSRCTQLTPNCQNCYSLSGIKMCTSCMKGYMLFSNQCFSCIENCISCSSDINCTVCKLGFTLYQSSKTGLNKCVECPLGCDSCSLNDNGMECASCFPASYLNSSNQCASCSPNCWNCFSDINCTLCQSGFILFNNSLIQRKCYKIIQNCFIYNLTDGNCLTCILGYDLVNDQCVSSTQSDGIITLACDAGQYLVNWTCQTSNSTLQNCIEYNQQGCIKCNQTFYLQYNSSGSLSCFPCAQGCQTCLINATICLSCIDGYFLDTSDIYFTCIKCHPTCKTCYASSSYCTSCNQSYILTSSLTCVSKSNIGFQFTLVTNYSAFKEILNDVKNQIISLISRANSGSTKIDSDYLNVFFIKIKNESTVSASSSENSGSYAVSSSLSTAVEGNISYYDESVLTQVYTGLSSMNLTSVNKVKVVSIEIQLNKLCADNQQYDYSTNQCITVSKSQSSSTNLALILGLSLGIGLFVVIIVTAIILRFFYSKKQIKVYREGQQQVKNNKELNEHSNSQIKQNDSQTQSESNKNQPKQNKSNPPAPNNWVTLNRVL